MTVDEANHANTVGSSWRRVVSLLEQDHRVSPRQRGFVILAQAQGLIEIVLPGGVLASSRGRPCGRSGATAGSGSAGRALIALPSGVRVYIACGATDMRKGMVGLAMLVQQGLGADPFDGADTAAGAAAASSRRPSGSSARYQR